MTLNEFAKEAYSPNDIHNEFFDSLYSGQDTQLVGCRQSGKSTALAIYMAYHLITNTREDARTIMFSSWNSSVGKQTFELTAKFLREYEERRGMSGSAPWANNRKVQITMANGNNIEYFDSTSSGCLRGVRDIRTIILDEPNPQRLSPQLFYTIQQLDTQIVLVGKRPTSTKGFKFNFYSLPWHECGKDGGAVVGGRILLSEQEFHSQYERLTPYSN
tara:strand:- start:1069 stop:1719 length:651 start_codon:yes stop_codon:yes gene_type:complete